MSITKRVLMHRNGRDQYGLDGEDDIDEISEEERLKRLEAYERYLKQCKEERIKKEKEEKEEREKRNKETKEFFLQFGIEWEPCDPNDVMHMNYNDYLDTPLWGEIKKRVLKRDKRKCVLCGAKTNLVHHVSYERDVLEGRNDNKLISLCRLCHKTIEFDDKEKRLVEEKKLYLKKIIDDGKEIANLEQILISLKD